MHSLLRLSYLLVTVLCVNIMVPVRANDLQEDEVELPHKFDSASSKQQTHLRSKNLPKAVNEEKLLHEIFEQPRLLDISNPLKPTDWKNVSSCYPDTIQKIAQYAPIYDFDNDSCLPAAAVSSTGQQNGGLKPSGSMTGECRSSDFMKRSNTYHRWNRFEYGANTYEFHMYELYFEKDQTNFGGWPFRKIRGHRHDLENVLIMLKNNQPHKVGVSAHGDYKVKSWTDAPKSGTHVKVVYHSETGGFNTHAFRFAKRGETPENPERKWVTPPLVSWYYMKGVASVPNWILRNKMNTFNFGGANVATKDSNFAKNVRKLFSNVEFSIPILPFTLNGEGQAIKCSTSDPAVYRYTNKQLRHYPNPVIASSWDKNWGAFKLIDCSGIPKGSPMVFNVKEGQAVKCSASDPAVYRYTNKQLRHYPNPTVASYWDKNWGNFKVIDCLGIPKGSPMSYDVDEGQAVKCSASDPAVYRYTNKEIRLYPNPAIASSWDKNWGDFIVIDCLGVPKGSPMLYNVSEGQAVKCSTSDPTVYRYTNKQLRHYPNPAIAESWDRDWERFEVIDCRGLPIGPPMPYKEEECDHSDFSSRI